MNKKRLDNFVNTRCRILMEQSADSKKTARELKTSDASPFPNMKKWWMEPKDKIMRFVYWAKGQLPPSNKRDFDKNWKKVVEQLQEKHPAPTERVYKARLNQK